MLSCIVGNKSVNSFIYEETKLRKWSNKGILKCPECGEKVIYCNGDYKVPYFRHDAKSDCVGSYSEPMTDEHINGIKLLFDRLSEIEGVSNLEVEKYIKNTRQRPDIYFEYEGDRYCIEYQCSPISTQYNRRHELYELENIKDIWILGTEKYNFDKYEKDNEKIHFKEKKIKTIEDEVDKSSSPLLYLDVLSEVLYRVDAQGFLCIHRWKGKYEKFKETILKTKIRLNLDIIPINNTYIKTFVEKENKSIDYIIKDTANSILEIEELIKLLKDKYNIDVKFEYNLDNDRFPIYKTNLLGNREFYEGACKVKDFINDYIDYLNYANIVFNEINNGNYKMLTNNGRIIINNINDNFEVMNEDLYSIIKEYSYGLGYIYNFKKDNLKHIIKNSIISDKRRITKMKNEKIKMENLKLINDVVISFNSNECIIDVQECSVKIKYKGNAEYVEFNTKNVLSKEDIKNTINIGINNLKYFTMKTNYFKKSITNIVDRFNKCVVGTAIKITKLENKYIEIKLNYRNKSNILSCEYYLDNKLVVMKSNYNEKEFSLLNVNDISDFISNEIRRLRYGQV